MKTPAMKIFMKILLSFVRKECCHILRDPLTLLVMFGLPIVLMTVLGYAVSTELKNIPCTVMDLSQSQESRALIERLDANAYFQLKQPVHTPAAVEDAFRKGLCAMAIIIPESFGREMLRSGTSDIQALIDASDPNQASVMAGYLRQATAGYRTANAQPSGTAIVTEVKMLYNPQMLSTFSIVPGLQGMVLILICAMMTSIAVVREKELGTMEILLVSPLRPQVIILAKAIPYLVISVADVVLILLLSGYVLGVPVRGSLWLLSLLSLIYIFTALSMGTLISTVARTQQTAMVAAGVGLMLPTLLLSGLIFPVDSLPVVLRVVSHAIPARWFIDASRDVMIKGMGFEAVRQPFFILLGMCVFFTAAGIKRFNNRL
jgi:ABC-2 type transport system permease protein